MQVAIAIFVGLAVMIGLAGSIVTNVKLWGLVRESRASLRRLSPQRRRRVLIQTALMYGFVLAEGTIVLSAPFDVRRTLTYFVILPVLILTPIGLLAVGIRGFRAQRRRRRPS